MCGIVGITGNPNAVSIVLEGLSRLEYRGYDSAGLVVQLPGGAYQQRKAVGKLAALREELSSHPVDGATVCIGHTRWATHGEPSVANAHPHEGTTGTGPSVNVVHNGIIENYLNLRTELSQQGVTFRSQTDTETIPFLFSKLLTQQSNAHTALDELGHAFHGNYAIAAVSAGHPGTLFATRKGAPLCLAVGPSGKEAWQAVVSDPLALAGLTDTFILLEDGDTVELTPTGYTIHNAAGQPVTRKTQKLDLSTDLAGKQGHRHFMLKEIHEQPSVVARILETYTTPEGNLNLPELPSTITAVNIVACGTASLAAQIAKYLFEDLASIPVNVDIASEFRYRNPPLPKGGLFIAISQSGETADTLAALEHAKTHGQHILTLTNVPTSSMARAAHTVLDLRAGREVAVASTKAFTAMVLCLTLLALKLSNKSTTQAITQLRTLPNTIESLLSQSKTIAQLADTLTTSTSMLYLGRGVLAPLAMEGALKMKELSYIHAEGYASGEMKHGPIALVDSTLPVVNLASGGDGLFEKTLSNMREVEARHGRIILITDQSGASQLDEATRQSIQLITLPNVPKICLPLAFTIPLQLLAYHTANIKGTDVDQPRNLAKSVTVE